MRIALVGKAGSITHWLEGAAAAWRREGHEVALTFTRRPWLAAMLEAAMAPALAERARVRLIRFRPDLILIIGAFHVPPPLLEAIAGLPRRPPLAGWVGDRFGEDARALAGRYDLLAYTDGGLLARHREWGFAGEALYLPHAVDPAAAPAQGAFEARAARMVFVANPTDLRRAVVAGLAAPITLYGPAWRAEGPAAHEIHARRIAAARVGPIYAAHRAVLNIRNEVNVLGGLNQRNFEPCLAGAALLTDGQADLETCFEPGREVLVWRDGEELNDLHARVLADAAFAEAVAKAGRARVLAHHTFAHRLESLAAALGLPKRGARA